MGTLPTVNGKSLILVKGQSLTNWAQGSHCHVNLLSDLYICPDVGKSYMLGLGELVKLQMGGDMPPQSDMSKEYADISSQLIWASSHTAFSCRYYHATNLNRLSMFTLNCVSLQASYLCSSTCFTHSLRTMASLHIRKINFDD